MQDERVRAPRKIARLAAAAALLASCVFSGPRAETGGKESASAMALGERAFAHLEAQCAFGPRVPGSPGHARALEYLRRTLAGAGARVELQSFTHTAPGLPAPVELTNVIARFGPQRAGGLLLAAHWDTRPWADLDPDPARRDEPILGANDGASGTGLLLALAERLREDPPRMPVILVFFDGEDLGRADHPEEYLAGSRYFANHFSGPAPEMGLVLDMVGSRSMTLTLEQASRDLFPDKARLIDELAGAMEAGAYNPNWGPLLADDHIPLISSGLPVLCLVDFRDPAWHTHADRPENCSAASLGETARVVLGLVGGDYFR